MPIDWQAMLQPVQQHKAGIAEVAIGFVLGAAYNTFDNRRSEKRRDRSARQISSEQSKTYTWPELDSAARQAADEVIRPFKPDVIITFAGPSAIFASLVIVHSCERDELLRIPILTGRFVSKTLHSDAIVYPEFETLESERFYVLIPKDVCLGDRKRKIVIIDDTISTGSSMQALREYLVRLGYSQDRIKTACCICSESARIHLNPPIDFAAFWNQGVSYRLPWGVPL